MFTALPACANTLHTVVDDGLQGFRNAFLVTRDDLGDIYLTPAQLLRYLLRTKSRVNHRVGEIEQGAFAQYAFLLQGIHYHIGQRHIVGIHAIDAHQTAQRTLHSYGGVLLSIHIGSMPSCSAIRSASWGTSPARAGTSS